MLSLVMIQPQISSSFLVRILLQKFLRNDINAGSITLPMAAKIVKRERHLSVQRLGMLTSKTSRQPTHSTKMKKYQNISELVNKVLPE